MNQVYSWKGLITVPSWSIMEHKPIMLNQDYDKPRAPGGLREKTYWCCWQQINIWGPPFAFAILVININMLYYRYIPKNEYLNMFKLLLTLNSCFYGVIYSTNWFEILKHKKIATSTFLHNKQLGINITNQSAWVFTLN